MPIRHNYIQILDLTGPDAAAVVQLVDVDDLGRDAPPINVTVKIDAATRQAIRDGILGEAKRRLNRRLNKAKADRQADPAAHVNLHAEIPNEDAP
jgi:hypothetical protein